jgi:4-alpha-glucanotransferase
LTDNCALAELAETCGIAHEFQNYRNERVETALDLRGQVLSRMGICGEGDDPGAVLAQLRDDRWSRALPTLLHVDVGAPMSLALRLPSDTAWDALTLAVTTECGSQTTLRVNAADAAVLATWTTEAATGTRELREPRLTHDLAAGYHRATLHGGDGSPLGEATLIVTPPQAYRPHALHRGERIFGLSAQLYTLRSARNWGIGDFSDLCELVRGAASQGADLVGISPLHALFAANPGHISPYSPSNRAFLNTLYIDPEAIDDFAHCPHTRARVFDPEFQARLAALRAAHQVDYAGVATAKMPVLESLYERFRTQELQSDSERGRAFQAFVDAGGEALHLHALFDCLHEHFLGTDSEAWGWPAWPAEYRDPRGDAAATFAARHADRLQFFLYLQWCADEQLAAAQSLARSLGMATGIYLDLAVGVDLAGSEVWSNQASFALAASAGAPPDELARAGQDWGFPPLCPRHLASTDYALFIRNLRASMRRAGAVRYDHAVSLERLWWIPEPGNAARGAFVHYDLDALLGILALESQREECLIIGEDLGTVPPRLRDCMAARHIFSYKVLYFEKHDGRMRAPTDYTPEAAATVTTHDLATLASWWDGSDIELRAGLGLLGDDTVADQLRRERAADRRQLLLAVQEHSGWTGSLEPSDLPRMSPELSAAVHRFLAATAAGVMLTQLEDLMSMYRPVNVPGTADEYANWQRKLRYPLEGLFERESVAALCAAMREQRSVPSSRS